MKKMVIDITISLLLFILGICMLVLPLFHVNQVDWILFAIFIVLAFVKLIEFIITLEDKRYENLYIFIISMLVGVLGMQFRLFLEPLKLAMALLVWTTGMSLVKLKEADYYHDHHNIMWKSSLMELAIFIVVSIITSINLYHSPQIQMLVLGFFFLVYGILELWNPVIDMLMKGMTMSEDSK